MPLADPISPPTSARPLRLPTPVLICAIFGLTLAAYFPALKGGQVWDDPAHLTAPALQSAQGLAQIWFQLGVTQQYYPVLHSAFWVEHRAWGDEVLGYHLVNVGLHATAACLFALLLAQLRSINGRINPLWRIEWLAAAVFALHPVGVESVAWISEQKNTLSLVFYLLAALAYLRFDRDRRWRWYALGLGLFVLALLSKSVTATLPAALLLVFYWQRGRVSWTRDVVPLLPWFVLGAGAGLFTAWVEHHYIGAKGAAYDLSYLQRCFLAGRVVWFYLGKLLWPADLMFIYPRWQVGATALWSFGSLALVGVLAGLWRVRRWSRAPLVAGLFFVGSLFPALGFVNVYPFIFSYVADHWQYLAGLGIIAVTTEGAALGLRVGLARHTESRRTAGAWAGALVAGGVLAILFILTWRQAGVYRNAETLYSDTLAKNPDCWMAHNNLGLCLMDSGALAESIFHLQAAVRLKPDCADAYNNLGNALTKTPGREAESIVAFERALQFAPDMPEAHSNLGWALVNFPGRLSEGIAHLRTALQLQPKLFRAYNSLGLALMKTTGQELEAIAAFETALRFDSDFVAARINLGNVLVVVGRVPEAIAQFEWAQRLSPENAQIKYNLGTALARSGRVPEAADVFERALRLQPGNAEAHNNLGNVLTQLGREPEALMHYRAALQFAPGSADAHFNLARALRGVGDGAESIVHYREALRLAPGDAEIWNSLGSFYYRLDQPTEAIAAYAEAVRLQPDSALLHNNLGIALTAVGRLEGAMVELRQAIRLDPPFADAHYNLGVALHQAGRAKEAAAEFKASGRAPE